MTLGAVGIVVAARMGSQRLPGKALLPLRGVPMLAFLLRRLLPSRQAQVVLATTNLAADDVLAELAARELVPVFRGASDDVVARYVAAAERFKFDTVVRITADCPFVDAELADYCLERAAALMPFDLATTKSRFPVGLDAEIYRAAGMAALNCGDQLTAADREHLTLHYYQHADRFAVRLIEPPADWLPLAGHLMVDTAADYARASALVDHLPAADASLTAVMSTARRQHADQDARQTVKEQ
jgi:spore coat polysaccharide biosynthesis protein SpsF